MKRDHRLLLGPAAAAVFILGIIVLAQLVPGYSQVRQTVSEIGEMGSPARIPFAVLLCGVGGCLVVFAFAVRNASVEASHGRWAAVLIGAMAVSASGAGIFAYPHPLHNVFGLSELIAYQAPLVLAWGWRKDSTARRLVGFSWILAAVIWASIAVNLVALGRGSLWAHLQPTYGITQRSLFVAFFGWCAVAGVLLWRRGGRIAVPEPARALALEGSGSGDSR